MSWLQHSMQLEINKAYLLLPTAKDIWEAINKTYFKIGFASQVFQIKRYIINIRQGSLSATDFNNSLKGLLKELDLYQNVPQIPITPSNKMRSMLEMEWVFQFLLELNPQFNQVCGRVLGKDQPQIIDGQQNQRQWRFYNKLTLAISKPNQNARYNKKALDNDKLCCDYSNKPRHTRSICWKLHGKPQNLKKINNKEGNQPTKLGQANDKAVVEQKPQQQGFNRYDIARLKQLLNQLENSNANSSSNLGSCSRLNQVQRLQFLFKITPTLGSLIRMLQTISHYV